MEITTSENLSLAVLRLASQVRLDKSAKQYHSESEKLLWEYHKTKLEHIETRNGYCNRLKVADEVERASSFRTKLLDARSKLDRNQVRLEIVQKLVHQLEGRSQNYFINVDKLEVEKPFVRIDSDTEGARLCPQEEVIQESCISEIDSFRNQTEMLQCRFGQLQTNINQFSDDSIKTTSDLIYDVISK